MINNRLDAQTLKTRDSYISKLKDMGIFTLGDLLLYFPRTYRDEQEFTRINEMRTDKVNVVQGMVKSMVNMRTGAGKVITRAVVADSSGEIPIIWFNQGHIKHMFFKGSEIILTGKMKYDKGKMIMISPKYEKPANVLLHTGRIVPVYPESKEITSKWLRGKIHSVLSYVKYFEEYLPKWILEEESLMGIKDAIYNIHFAKDDEHLTKAHERLAFDELFILQFMALKRKLDWQTKFDDETKSMLGIDLKDFLDALPFDLTEAQSRVIDEICDDLTKDHPMIRLVQGDVGSGKTAVALAAVFAVYKNGKQSAIMAPTEILVRQHYKSVMKLLASFNLNIQILTGSLTEKEKTNVLRQLATGTCDLVIGTQSLIQEGVAFSNLGLVVVDEQHRFGVKQRNIFKMHGSPHMLTLSATPIPRTMALTIYGDQDLSLLDEMPPGRQEIVTRLVPEKKRSDAYIWVTDQVNKGRQVFVICPLVEESENIQVKSAIEEYERLSKEVFTEHKLALLHGRMKGKEKDEIMKRFGAGEIDILVSTSVVEVGIDVPNATIMLIEGAERFGLAQLHQFRGRVGRGQFQSYCFLFSDKNSSDSLRRLNYMVKHSSGFDLAEFDLQMRGPGEVYGVKQSGIPDLKMATLTDSKFLIRVRKQAQQLLDKDPYLLNYIVLREKVEKIEFEAEV